jgi:two-component system LytT family response regulator
VFLDVQMPEMDGFAVVEEVGAANMPAVVFVTAHDTHAIQAFEINAIDYLLKPVTEARFVQALGRAKARLEVRSADDASRQVLSLLETIARPRRYLMRLAVRSGDRTVLVAVEDVEWIEAAENYVELHGMKTSHLMHVPLSALEKSLDPALFMRIHRSVIVQIGRIKELQPAQHGEYVITLASGARLRSGRTYNDRLKPLLANPF